MDLYGLPFDGIKGIRAEMGRLEDIEAALLEDAKVLKQECSKAFGYGTPIALLQERNKAFIPLRWRDMSKGSNNRVRIVLDCDVGQQLQASLPEEKWRELLGFELRRMHLSHALGLVRYELSRLKRLESEFNAWRKLMRDLKPQ
jgi:hypothetical protein